MIQLWLLRYWKELAALALLAFAVWRGYDWAYDNGSRDTQAKWDKERIALLAENAKTWQRLRDLDRTFWEAMTGIAEAYEQDKRNAQKEHDRLVSDLRNGNVRLQDRWAGCVSEAGRTAAELDAAKRDREESAARIIAAADQCDAQNAGLQKIIRADRVR